MRASRRPFVFAVLGLSVHAALAAAPAAVPATHIPPPVLAELARLESQFDVALAQDCGTNRCFSKGCVYVEHVVVDQPRQTSLPGLPATEGPGAGPPQEYLTQARCDFAYENTVPAKDVLALTRRLKQKLTHGWLVVTVHQEPLEPAPAPEPTTAKAEPAPAPPPPAPKPKLELDTAVRELWLTLLPHFWWMIGFVLATFTAMTLIWSSRRLGRESAEEQALLAQLGAERSGERPVEPQTTEATVAPPEQALAQRTEEADRAFVESQRVVWNTRIAGARLSEGDGVLTDLVREWLLAREFGLLAKAVFFFSDRVSLAFPTEGDLAMRKLEFADYMRTVDESKLPSDAEFLRTLNNHAVSSTVLAQSDTEVYRSLREEFGSAGIARLVAELPARQGALLFALIPPDYQMEVGRVLSADLKSQVAEQLLMSNRVAKDEIARLLGVLKAARAGQPMPPQELPSGVADRGREFDAAGALSNLFPHIDPATRSVLFMAALERSNGAFPLWYEEILHADMLLKVPDELRAEVLLDVDIRELAGWFSMQLQPWQDSFMPKLAPSMQNALRASLSFPSRAQQLVLARRGRASLAASLQRQVARGKVSFTDVAV